MNQLSRIINYVFVYCTDFIINLANLFNWSYYEFNALFFCLIYPLVFFGFLVLFFVQKRRLRKLQT